MLRVSNIGCPTDPLVKILKNTSYGDNASGIAGLMRNMIKSYHDSDSISGDKEAKKLSQYVMNAIPTATKVSKVGIFNVYQIEICGNKYRCTWRELLAKGTYNYVYYADLNNMKTAKITPAVVKVTREKETDLRVYLLENVIHAILCELKSTCEFVVPFHFPFKVHKTEPPYVLGVVLEDPCNQHMGDWIVSELKNDDQMFSIITQLCWTLHSVQKAIKMEHRDLKCDNIMVVNNPNTTQSIDLPNIDLSYEYPTLDAKCLLIDFGVSRMEINNEYIACDCLNNDTKHNQSTDLQYFCLTLLEDYAQELSHKTPIFYKWLCTFCVPLYEDLYKRFPNYDNLSQYKKNEKAIKTAARAELTQFIPHSLLKSLSFHWQKM